MAFISADRGEGRTHRSPCAPRAANACRGRTAIAPAPFPLSADRLLSIQREVGKRITGARGGARAEAGPEGKPDRRLTRRQLVLAGARLSLGAASAGGLCGLVAGCKRGGAGDAPGQIFTNLAPLDLRRLKLTLIYDNRKHAEGVVAHHGYSCHIAGADRSILFDTGRQGPILVGNARALGIPLAKVQVLFFSHSHMDHTGGFGALMRENRGLDVILPKAFPPHFKKKISRLGGRVFPVSTPARVGMHAFSTGEMFVSRTIDPIWDEMREQALVLRTTAGLVIVAGCSHPGVIRIVERARQLTGDDVLLVLGTIRFFTGDPQERLEQVRKLKAMHVRYVAPAHTTPEAVHRLLRQEFGQTYLKVGAGWSLTGDRLR